MVKPIVAVSALAALVVLVKIRGKIALTKITLGLLGLAAAVILKLRVPPKPKKIASKAVDIPKNTLSQYSDGMRFKTTDGTDCLPIRASSKGLASIPATTIHGLFAEIIRKGKGGFPALCTERPCPPFTSQKADVPSAPLHKWHKWTYKEYYMDSRTVAKGFLSLGLDRHASVNIWGFNSPEWFIAEIGAIFGGGRAAGIYPTDTPDQVLYKLQHSNGQIVCIQDEKKLAALSKIKGELKKVKAIVAWEFDPTEEQKAEFDVPLLSWDELMKAGESFNEQALEDVLNDQQPGECCALIYTSGTTGTPKAVMISHDNIIFEASLLLNQVAPFGTKFEQERLLSYLPLSHVAGMLLDIIAPLYTTARQPSWVSIFYARSYDLSKGTVGNRLRAVKPTIFLGVPRVWEKISLKIKAIGAQTKGLKRVLANWCKGKGLEHAHNCQLGGNGAYPTFYQVANKFVLSKIKAKLGLQFCKVALTGAAPISRDTLAYFGALGIQVNEAYGMSECSGATTWSTDTCHMWGSCGYTLPSTEVKIFERTADGGRGSECKRAPSIDTKGDQYEGEICYRGRHIMMGYLANPDMGEAHVKMIRGKTDDAIDDDGWLHSGDKGLITTTGMIKITGRYKELLIGAGGENVAPVPIEDAVKEACPEISNIMMFGDRKPFLAALVTLRAEGNPGETPGTDVLACRIPGSSATTITEARKDPAVIAYITQCIAKGNKTAPNNASTIKKFTILPRDFSVQGLELTSTLKTKRSVVLETYSEVVARTYTQKGRDSYVPFEI